MTGAAPFSVYVHIPFCARKCPYCDFNTYAVTNPPEAEYVRAVCHELASYRDSQSFAGRRVRSVFFGGGTPSLFSADSIARILTSIDSLFPIEHAAEITLEANPNHADSERLVGFRAAGVNRISFGAQSFNSKQLELLGRDHTAAQAIHAVSAAREAGITNVSVDIIFGVPGQTLADVECDLEIAADLPVTHLSAYSLTIEPGTPFFQRQERGLLRIPPDERVAAMLERIPVILAARDFERYEISNYARGGARSLHNQVYWQGGDYLGIGAGAHSYGAHESAQGIQGVVESAVRWGTLALPSTYIVEAMRGSSVSWRENLDTAALIFEFFYLGLRMIEGVSLKNVRARCGVDLPANYKEQIEQLVGEGFLIHHGDSLRLSPTGILLADSVFERLVC